MNAGTVGLALILIAAAVIWGIVTSPPKGK